VPLPAACDIVTTSGTANPALLAPSSPAPQQSTASTPVMTALALCFFLLTITKKIVNDS